MANSLHSSLAMRLILIISLKDQIMLTIERSRLLKSTVRKQDFEIKEKYGLWQLHYSAVMALMTGKQVDRITGKQCCEWTMLCHQD